MAALSIGRSTFLSAITGALTLAAVGLTTPATAQGQQRAQPVSQGQAIMDAARASEEEANRRAAAARARGNTAEQRTICMTDLVNSVRTGRIAAEDVRGTRFSMGINTDEKFRENACAVREEVGRRFGSRVFSMLAQ